MFRDRDEELDRLEAALQENPDGEEEYEECDEEYAEEEAHEDDAPLPDFDAYNSDVSDEDLEEFSDAVYEGSRQRRLGLLAFALVALCIVLTVLAVCLLKYGGYLG